MLTDADQAIFLIPDGASDFKPKKNRSQIGKAGNLSLNLQLKKVQENDV